ncbi:MAG: phage holin family protein [Anaerolineaceae bacterium]|jgi:putative membrane protein
MKKFIIRILINAVALFAAVAIMRNNGIHPQDTNWLSFLGLALIFGLINALIKPVLSFLTCPLIILTLGLGTLLINTLLFWLAGWVGTAFGVGFTVDGFIPAFLGALIVSIVSIFLSALLRDEIKGRK